MSHIYVPINVSNLADLIPPGDDILYSTFCDIAFYRPGVKWRSHILVSQSGFATYTRVEDISPNSVKPKYRPLKKKLDSIPEFVPWHAIIVFALKKTPFTKEKIIQKLAKLDSVHYKVAYEAKFESKDSYKQRYLGFTPFCRALWEESAGKFEL